MSAPSASSMATAPSGRLSSRACAAGRGILSPSEANTNHLHTLANFLSVLREIQSLSVSGVNYNPILYHHQEPHHLSRTCTCGHLTSRQAQSNQCPRRMHPLPTTNASRSANAHDPAKNLWQVNVWLRYCQGVGERPLARLQRPSPSSIAPPADALERYPPSRS